MPGQVAKTREVMANFNYIKANWGSTGAGTVTSVGLSLPATEFSISGSPVITSGTLTGAWLSQTQHFVLAAPSGGNGTPSFRALVASDIPALPYGTVTSVAATVPAEFSVSGSPITGSGTLAITKANESANTVWAGPTTGAAAQPTFRSLVTADMPAGTGTVTSVNASVPAEFSVSGVPITGTGTIAITKANETANTVWAGPTTGAAAQPTFRALVAADIPSLPYGTGTVTSVATASPITGGTITTTGTIGINDFVASGASHARGAVPDPGVSAGSTKFLCENATWAVPPGTGSGTVTSVGLSMPAEFSVANSPVTTSNTLAVTKANQSANLVYAGPSSGGAAAPTFRALTAADVPGSAGGSMVFLDTHTASTSSTIDFASLFSSTYDCYFFLFFNLLNETNATGFETLFTTDNGGTYLSSNYQWARVSFGSSGVSTSAGSTSDSKILWFGDQKNNGAFAMNGYLYIYKPLDTTFGHTVDFYSASMANADGLFYKRHGIGGNTGTTALTGVRFLYSSGHITSGTIVAYGIAH